MFITVFKTITDKARNVEEVWIMLVLL